MGVPVLILGHSGSGKSTSLRNFEQGEIGLFNVTGKPLPFRKRLDMANRPLYGSIMGSLQRNAKRAYVVDDANYLMAFENFKKAKDNGYSKFVDMALHFEQLLETIAATDDDTITYVMMHPEIDAQGRMKPKTIGKMLDEKLCIEGMFPIVLIAERDDSGYWFVTQSDGYTPAKSPMGMFEQERIENDLKAVDTIIRDYYELAPLSEAKKPATPKKVSADADKS